MAFAVICKSCQARFLLNDDLLRRKVAGRVVTVRCRQCHAAIEVDASNVELKSATQHQVPEPAPAPPPPAAPLQPKAPRPAPSPPRPAAKSTLMGIGGPAKPPGVPELVALSPGLLHIAGPTTSTALSPQGFPEPPPPPASFEVEELDGDWEVAETPALANVEPAPESLDDFAEELPPSLPPPEEELPSSTGTPSLAALTHHDDRSPAKPNADDFITNMHAAMNGGVMSGGQLGAPTIDVSALAVAPAAPADPGEVDLSAFDVPLSGKQTLPLFSLTDDEAKTPTPGIVGRAAAAGAAPAPLPSSARPSAPRPADGSLSPAAVDRASREPPRERRNVVAPATKSDPPATSRSRSALAAPLLLVVAAAAGFLIWKRTSTSVANDEVKPASAALSAPPAQPATAEPPPEPPASVPAAAAPALPADDITFEPAPSQQPAAQQPRSASPEPAAPRSAPPSEPKPAAAEPAAPVTPSAPVTKDEPKAPSAPATPAEPAGPFDRAAAAAALSAGAAQASACRKEGDPSGVASVVITFAPSGRVTSATIGGPPFAGTATGGCIAAALRKARVPPFEGERVTVSKTIVVQ